MNCLMPYTKTMAVALLLFGLNMPTQADIVYAPPNVAPGDDLNGGGGDWNYAPLEGQTISCALPLIDTGFIIVGGYQRTGLFIEGSVSGGLPRLKITITDFYNAYQGGNNDLYFLNYTMSTSFPRGTTAPAVLYDAATENFRSSSLSVHMTPGELTVSTHGASSGSSATYSCQQKW